MGGCVEGRGGPVKERWVVDGWLDGWSWMEWMDVKGNDLGGGMRVNERV